MAYAIVAVIVLILDQASKYLTTLDIALNGSVPLIPGVIELTNIHNTGAAFGLLSDVELARWLFVGLTVVLCAVIIVLLAKNVVKSKFARWMLVLIMAGGLGNCIDRVINGYVTDMFNFLFISFPVFNVADVFISVCGLMFIIYLIVSIFKGGGRKDLVTEDVVEPEPRTVRRAPAGDYTERQSGRQDYIAHLQQSNVKKDAAPAAPLGEVKSWDDFDVEPPKAPAQPSHTRPAAPAQVRPAAPAKTSHAAAPEQPRPVQSAPKAPAAPKAAQPKADADEYSLENILAEFSDK